MRFVNWCQLSPVNLYLHLTEIVYTQFLMFTNSILWTKRKYRRALGCIHNTWNWQPTSLSAKSKTSNVWLTNVTSNTRKRTLRIKGLLTLSQHFLSHFEIYINKFSEFKLLNAFDEQLHHYTTGDSPLELRHSKLASASRNTRFLTWIGVFNTWSRLFRTDRWESSWYAWATGRRVRRTWHRSTSHHQ